MKVSVCFFGITRSLSRTHDSILDNVLNPLKKHSSFTKAAHLYDLKAINNSRSNENAKLSTSEYLLLDLDYLMLEKPDSNQGYHQVSNLKSFGDSFNDEYQSFGNLISQLLSLDKVTSYSLEQESDMVVFLRPDLEYLDSFEDIFDKIFSKESFSGEFQPKIYLPAWQSWQGCNDRFSVCVGKEAIRSYGLRLNKAMSYCLENSSPLHSERLLKYSLDKDQISIKPVYHRAQRVRADGKVKKENFDYFSDEFRKIYHGVKSGRVSFEELRINQLIRIACVVEDFDLEFATKAILQAKMRRPNGQLILNKLKKYNARS